MSRARELRSQMTEPERLLWSKLRRRQLGARFRRQAPIGRYIVDFVSFEHRLVIEVDGGQHAEHREQRRDALRTAWLESQGFRVLRFWNNDVMGNLEGVLEVVGQALGPPPGLPHNATRRGEED